MKKKVKSKKTIGFSRVFNKVVVEKIKQDAEKKNKQDQFGLTFNRRFPTLCEEILKVVGPDGNVGFYDRGICVSSPRIKRWAAAAYLNFVPIMFYDIFRDGRHVPFEEFTNKDVSERIASELAEYLTPTVRPSVP